MTVALLGELVGRTEISQVCRWLASYSPRIALEILVEENNDGLVLADVIEQSPPVKVALMHSANARIDETNPVGRAAAYRVLGHPDIDADDREGVGLRPDGLPDIVWRPVEAGTYTVGGDSKAYQPLNEQPYEVPEGVQIALYPVTYQQFEAFVKADDFEDIENPCWANIPEDERGPKSIDEQRYKYGNHPRENVSWYGAVAFCRWLTEQYRAEGIIGKNEAIALLDERLWEAAARGKGGKFYPFGGDQHDASKANVRDTGVGQTSAVGIFPEGAADCGALDMSGNVWEWTASKFDDPNDMSIDSSNSQRVLRGASFDYGSSEYLRAAARNHGRPYYRGGHRGFRVVRVPIN